MSVELVKEDNLKQPVFACDLKDGQIGIVIEDYGSYLGRVVQRFGDDIVTLGSGKGKGFGGECKLEIRLLKKGESIIIKDN